MIVYDGTVKTGEILVLGPRTAMPAAATPVSAPDRHALWRRYLSAKHMGGTDAECRFAFDAWWKPEKADAFATTKAELRATKKTQAKAIR